MSSRDHHCPRCDKDWHCIGCHTQDTERLCDNCMNVPGEIQDALRAHFALVGLTVDFQSGEVRDPASGRLHAHLDSYGRDGDQISFTLTLKHEIKFIPAEITVDTSKL